MKPIFVLLGFCIFFIQNGYAQQPKSKEVIFLKNGSVIRGVKALHHLDSLIEIQTTEGSVIRFEAADLDRITRETVRPEIRVHGYFIGLELGLNPGKSYTDTWGNNYRENTPTIQIVTGYQWTTHWSTGIGAGFDIYKNNTVIPVFARGMYMPLNSRLTPVVVMDLGYGFYTTAFNASSQRNQTIRGGLFLNPAAGFMVRTAKRTAFLFTIGYRQQDMFQTVQNGEIRTDQDLSFRRLSLRMSLLF